MKKKRACISFAYRVAPNRYEITQRYCDATVHAMELTIQQMRGSEPLASHEIVASSCTVDEMDG